jgi:hypothetical protein
MEIIIFVAVVVGAALLWSGYVKTKKAESDQTIDNWQPPKASPEKEWPFGEKLPEGKIHVKVADVAPVAPAEPTGSENRVETPAPVVTAPVLTVDGHGDVHEVKPAKKAPAKKTAAKPAVAKKAPAKKKSV